MKLRNLIFLPLFASGSFAANIIWNTAGPSNVWDASALNWTGDATVFTAGDNATFNAAVGETVTVDAGGVAPTSTAISNNGAWTFTGGSISGTLSKSGTAALTLSSANSFSTITLTGAGSGSGAFGSTNGSLKFANGNALGSGTIDFSAVTTTVTGFWATATTTVTNNIVLPTSFAFGVQAATGNTTTYSGIISGGSAANTVTFGAGTSGNPTSVTLLTNASNTFKGKIYAGRGVIAITSNGALGDAANTIQLDQGGTNGQFRFDANNIDVTHSFNISTTAFLNINGNDATISGNITGAGLTGIIGGTQSGGTSAGSLTISSANTNSKAYSINADTKLIAASVNALGTNTKTVTSGGTVAFKNVGTYTGTGQINLNGVGTKVSSVGVGALENISGTNVFNNVVNLASASTIGTTAGSLTLGGNVTGAFALTKIGSGKLTLSGTSAFTTLDINAGTFAAGSTTAFGTGLVSMANGTTLESSAVAPVSVPGGLTIGTIATDSNSLNFVGTSGYFDTSVGTTTINSGTGNVTINLLGAAPAIGQYPLIKYGGSLGGTGYPAFTLGSLPSRVIANLVDNVANTSVDINVTGVDFAVWSGAQSSEWSTNVISGSKNWVLNSNNATTTDYLTGDTVLFNGSATGTTVDISNGDVSPAAATFDGNSFTLTGSNGIAGTASLIKSGTGTLTISNTNSYTGGTTISGGTLQLGDGTTNGTITGNIANDDTLKFNNVSAQSFSGNITGNGGLIKEGAGDLTLAGINSYSGGTTVSTGTLTGTAASIQGSITNNASVVFAQASTGTYSGAMTGTGTLTKSGTGTLTLGNVANDYAGNTFLNAGTLAISAGTELGSGALQYTAAATLNASNNSAEEVGNDIVLASGVQNTILKNSSGSLSGTQLNLTGNISGGDGTSVLFLNSSAQSDGTTSYRLAGSNTFTGTITINRGCIELTSSASLGNTANLLFVDTNANNTDGVVRFDAAMTVTNPIQLNFTAVNAFNTKTHDVTLSGLISGARGMSKIGSGKLTLSGNNTYAGSTTVSAGTLLINGSHTSTSATTVSVGTTLGGVGTLAGSLTVNGNIAPGNGIGTFSAASTTINGSYACEVNGATADVIAATNLTLSATSALEVSETSGTFPIVIATYSGTLTGTFATVTPGYTVNYSTPGTILLTPGTVFDSWATLKGLDGTPGKEKGLADDPDGDGHNNLYEFAFDGNPLSGVNDGKVISKIATVGSDQVLTLTLPVRTGALFSASSGDLLSALVDGVHYRIEGDTDLGTFASAIAEVTGGDAAAIQTGLPTLATGWTYRTFSAPGTVTTVPKSFLRAKISETP